MPKTVNTRLYDNAVRHQIGIVRYSTTVARHLVGTFNRMVPDLLGQLSGHDPSDGVGAPNAARLDYLFQSLDAIVDANAATIESRLDTNIRGLADHEVDHTVSSIEAHLPLGTIRGIKARSRVKPKPSSFRPDIGFVIGVPTSEQVYAAVHARPFAGKHLNEYYSDLPDGIKAGLRSTIRQGYADGKTTDAIVRALRGTRAAKYADGVLQSSRRSIERVARTALNATANLAREQVYSSNSDIIDGVRWVSTLDNLTSDICMALDGQVFGVDEGPRPPAHPNCRSCTTPIVKSWRDLGFDIDELPEATRASMDGQVPASETYGTWLGRQSDDVQNDILGPTRADLFRDGGLTVDKFVDDSGQTLTLDQLRAREAGAFEKADL